MKTIEGWYGTPAHGANPGFRAPQAYFRHAVAKDVFGHIDQHAWRRLAKWLRCKHRIGWKQLRRRFCDRGWRIASKSVVFTGAASVKVTRYRYRGSTIPTPWTPTPAATG